MHINSENKEQSIIHCKNCAWFLPLHTMPEAEKLYNKLHHAFGDILPRREGETGVCRKVTFSMDKPVLTRENGFCHRAERKGDTA